MIMICRNSNVKQYTDSIRNNRHNGGGNRNRGRGRRGAYDRRHGIDRKKIIIVVVVIEADYMNNVN